MAKTASVDQARVSGNLGVFEGSTKVDVKIQTSDAMDTISQLQTNIAKKVLQAAKEVEELVLSVGREDRQMKVTGLSIQPIKPINGADMDPAQTGPDDYLIDEQGRDPEWNVDGKTAKDIVAELTQKIEDKKASEAKKERDRNKMEKERIQRIVRLVKQLSIPEVRGKHGCSCHLGGDLTCGCCLVETDCQSPCLWTETSQNGCVRGMCMDPSVNSPVTHIQSSAEGPRRRPTDLPKTFIKETSPITKAQETYTQEVTKVVQHFNEKTGAWETISSTPVTDDTTGSSHEDEGNQNLAQS